MGLDLNRVEHRPWPLPGGPWILAESWHDLLFAHWPVPLAILRSHVPPQLRMDTFHGQAWLGIVPFRMSGVRLRGTPRVSGLSAFPELNVRTYVVAEGKPGVWFFSLDAANAVAVAIARAWFHLPYFRARMSCGQKNGWMEYESERTHRGASHAALALRYRPRGGSFRAEGGSLEHFLTERYCLYARDNRGRVKRSEIHHGPWALESAEAELTKNTMAEAAGISLSSIEPLLHYSKRQDVVVWQPERLGT